jgi:NitT/TauT family transport system permease protein
MPSAAVMSDKAITSMDAQKVTGASLHHWAMAFDAVRRLAPPWVVIGITLLLWSALAPILNADRVRQDLTREHIELTLPAIVERGWWMDRPVLPSPMQLAVELWHSTTDAPPNSRHNLLFHVWATLSSSLVGMGLGVALGVVLAMLLVEFAFFEAATMPWIVASQAVPTLAIAPIVVILLGRLGLSGLWQKAAIDALIVFFPVTLGLVKGLRSPEPALLDLMATYAAPRWRTLVSIRLPASLPFLFPALKIAAAVAVVTTIVAELPTGADSGLGARLLVGSYTGLVLVMWTALIAAAAVAASLIGIITLGERAILGRMGVRR